jgi:hypothetical protein
MGTFAEEPGIATRSENRWPAKWQGRNYGTLEMGKRFGAGQEEREAHRRSSIAGLCRIQNGRRRFSGFPGRYDALPVLSDPRRHNKSSSPHAGARNIYISRDMGPDSLIRALIATADVPVELHEPLMWIGNQCAWSHFHRSAAPHNTGTPTCNNFGDLLTTGETSEHLFLP